MKIVPSQTWNSNMVLFLSKKYDCKQKFKSFRKWIDLAEKKWNRFTCQGIQCPCNWQLSDPKVQAIQIQWPAHFAQNLKSISTTISEKYSILYFLFQSIFCIVFYWRLLKLVLSKAVTPRKLHKIAIYWYSFSIFTIIFNITLLFARAINAFFVS